MLIEAIIRTLAGSLVVVLSLAFVGVTVDYAAHQPRKVVARIVDEGEVLGAVQRPARASVTSIERSSAWPPAGATWLVGGDE